MPNSQQIQIHSFDLKPDPKENADKKIQVAGITDGPFNINSSLSRALGIMQRIFFINL